MRNQHHRSCDRRSLKQMKPPLPLIEVGMRSKRRRSFGRAKHRRRRSLSGSRGGRKSPSILVPGYVYLQWKACNPGPDGIFLSPNCK